MFRVNFLACKCLFFEDEVIFCRLRKTSIKTYFQEEFVVCNTKNLIQKVVELDYAIHKFTWVFCFCVLRLRVYGEGDSEIDPKNVAIIRLLVKVPDHSQRNNCYKGCSFLSCRCHVVLHFIVVLQLKRAPNRPLKNPKNVSNWFGCYGENGLST